MEVSQTSGQDFYTFTFQFDWLFMMNLRTMFVVLFSIFLQFASVAQEVSFDDSLYTPYRKTRWLAGISGGILSSNSDQNQGENVFTNRYSFDINISYFLAKRFMAGLEFNIFRSAMSELIERESESVSIGPVGRFYLSLEGEGSVFFETGLRHGRYWEKTTLNPQSDSLKEYQLLTGKEFGVVVGVGYSHTLVDKIAFEMGMDYYFASLDGTIENTLNGTIAKADNTRIQFEFTVGFVVFLR